MSASKFLISATAAASVVGAIGFAYAQSSPATNPQTQPQATVPATPANPGLQNQPGASATTGNDAAVPSNGNAMRGSDNSGMTTERAAKADRN